MYMYQTGDLCPCCGQIITERDPKWLELFSLTCDILGLKPIEFSEKQKTND